MNAVEHSEGAEGSPLNNSNESKILRFLKQKFESRTALQIAKGIGFKTAKQVNPTLYALEKRNLVHKIQKDKKVEWLPADSDFEMMPAIVNCDDGISGSGGSEIGTVAANIKEESAPMKLAAEMFDLQKGSEIPPHMEHGKRHRQDSNLSYETLSSKHVRDARNYQETADTYEDAPMPIQCLDDDQASDYPVKPKSHSSLDVQSCLPGEKDSVHGIGRGAVLKSTWESTFRGQPSQQPGSSNQHHSITPNTIYPGKESLVPKAPHELLQSSSQVEKSNVVATSQYLSNTNNPNRHGYGNQGSGLYNQRSSISSHSNAYVSQSSERSQCDVAHQSPRSMDSNFSSFSGHSESYAGNLESEYRPRPSVERYSQQASSSLKPLMDDHSEGRYQTGNEDAKMADKIVTFLHSFNRPIATLEIAKAVSKGKKKDVNPILYDMQKKGIIYKATQQPPSWKLNTSTSDHQSGEIRIGQNEVYNRDQYQSVLSHQANDQSISLNPPRVSQSPRQLSWHSDPVVQEQYSSGFRNPSHQYIDAERSLLQQPHPMSSIPQQTNTGRNMISRHTESSAQSSNSLRSMQSQSVLPSELSGVTFAALSKNPVSALNEYAQKNQMELSFELLNEAKGGRNKFLVAVKMNGKMYNAVSAANMKDAKREAADLALREILSKQSSPTSQARPSMVLSTSLTHFDRMAMLSHQAFITISADIQEKFAGRKVLAAIIMTKYDDTIGNVVSIGSGNRCITGDRLNLEGKTVYDSHAEIVCRRAFLHYLYSEIDKFYCKGESIFEEGGMHGKLQIKDGVAFHLYISTAPCGDGALFSPRDAASVDPSAAANASRDHFPIFSSKQQGLLRTKIEDGEGTIPIDPNDGPQTWDGIVMGKRLRTMSCTDKVCRWNILGLQGALLSHLIDPIYLDSITLGYLYDHGHLSRAVCCRLNKQSLVDSNLPMPFYLNHPWLGRVTAYDPPRETEKTNNLSINWYLGSDQVEVTDGRAGCCLTRTDNAPTPSRLCKAELYQSFKKICSKVSKLHSFVDFDSYREAKENATSFQMAKEVMNKQFTSSRFGSWVKKPRELEMFDVNNRLAS